MASLARKLRRGSIRQKTITIGNSVMMVTYRVVKGGNGKLTKARRKRSPGKYFILDISPLTPNGVSTNI